jgi:hypothetical protein
MPRHNWYEMGAYNMSCDQCGRIFKSGELRLRWDNAWVDDACWEIRQPQDFVRGIPDNQSVPYARIRPPLSTTKLRIESGGYAAVISGPWQPFGNYFQCTAKVAFDDWTPGIFNTIFSNIVAGFGFNFYIDIGTGRPVLVYTPSEGFLQIAIATASPVVANGAAIFLKVEATLNNTNCQTIFSTSADGNVYTQLGGIVSSTGTGSFLTPNSYPVIGGIATDPLLNTTQGDFYLVEVLGAPAGSPRLSFNAALGAPGLTTFQAGSQLMQTTGEFEL